MLSRTKIGLTDLLENVTIETINNQQMVKLREEYLQTIETFGVIHPDVASTKISSIEHHHILYISNKPKNVGTIPKAKIKIVYDVTMLDPCHYCQWFVENGDIPQHIMARVLGTMESLSLIKADKIELFTITQFEKRQAFLKKWSTDCQKHDPSLSSSSTHDDIKQELDTRRKPAASQQPKNIESSKDLLFFLQSPLIKKAFPDGATLPQLLDTITQSNVKLSKEKLELFIAELEEQAHVYEQNGMFSPM